MILTHARPLFLLCVFPPKVPPEYYQDPEWRGKLVDLVLLDLQDNRLADLPPNFLAEMVSLRKLDISKNRQAVQQRQLIRSKVAPTV